MRSCRSRPEVKIADKKLEPLPPTAPVIPKQAVKTNVFSTGSSAPQTIAKAPEQVQTGGFGDPPGVPAKAGEGKAVNIAQLGSFDLPSGPGNGNGTGGARGSRGVVASTGFGNGISTGDGRVRLHTLPCSKQVLATPMSPRHRPFMLAPRKLPQKSFPRKFFPNRFRFTLRKPAGCALREKFFWKSSSKRRAGCTFCAWCVDWATVSTTPPFMPRNKFALNRHCEMASPPTPPQCCTSSFNWHKV